MVLANVTKAKIAVLAVEIVHAVQIEFVKTVDALFLLIPIKMLGQPMMKVVHLRAFWVIKDVHVQQVIPFLCLQYYLCCRCFFGLDS